MPPCHKVGDNKSHHLTPNKDSELLCLRRGIGVGVKGVTGRDAIVHKRRRNSSQKATQ